MKTCVECGKQLSRDEIEEGRYRCINCQIGGDATAIGGGLV